MGGYLCDESDPWLWRHQEGEHAGKGLGFTSWGDGKVAELLHVAKAFRK